MTAPVPKQLWEQYYRAQFETAFGAGGGLADWNIGGNGGGATGWRDLAVLPGTVGITPTEAQIFMANAAGKRAMNQQAPVPGAYEVAGSFEMPVIPELIYPIFRAIMGGVANVETAGSAALAATAFASVATLDTQPDGTEMLKFVIASSTAAAGAVFNIIQNAVTVETITIGDNAGSVNGPYYTKGAYDGSVNAITLTVEGTVTSGMVVISGVDKVTNTFTMSTSNPFMKLEEAGQPKSASNSSFYTGTAFKDVTLAFDRTAADGLLMATPTFMSKFPTFATAGTYANDAALFYHPLGAWTASLTKGGAAFDKVQSVSLVIDGGTVHFPVASGDQDSAGGSFADQQVSGTFTILPEDGTEWDAFVGQTVGDYHLIFTSPNFIVDTDPWLITIEMTALYLETYEENAQAGMFGANLGIRTTDDSADGIIKITTVTRMPV
jgi:hypothetical protein